MSAPRCTSKQKQADEEQVRQANNAKKLALQNTYNQISAVQADMEIKQAEAKNSKHIAMHPISSALQKEPHNELPVIWGPCYPYFEDQNPTKWSLHKKLAELTLIINTGEVLTDSENGSKEICFTSEHSKWQDKKRKQNILSHGEESEQEDTSKPEAITDTDLPSQTTGNGGQPGRLHLTSKTAIGVIKTHRPMNWKKVKLKGMENRNKIHMLNEMDYTDLGEQPVAPTSKSLAITRQDHGVASRKSCKAAKGSTMVTKATKANLPLLMLDDIDDKWTTVVFPCLILWYGD
ncbi:hypothetical protein HD554DRAFT_2037098 [Boletus coccyginus]|nr:hypothetical protein HD554DRAFT_2037098 [Boletus coccyginus]